MPRDAAFVRLGGLAGLVTLVLHILINHVLIDAPPQSGELEVVGSFSATAIGHGLRYPAFLCLAVFAVGLYVMTRGGDSVAGSAWWILGLLSLSAAVFAILNVIVAVFIVWVITGDPPPDLLLWARSILGLVCYLSACVLMVRRVP